MARRKHLTEESFSLEYSVLVEGGLLIFRASVEGGAYGIAFDAENHMFSAFEEDIRGNRLREEFCFSSFADALEWCNEEEE